MQRVPHLLGLGLEDLSHSQLDALEEMHTALLRSITEHRIKLVQLRERNMVEEAAAREHTKLHVAEQAALARNNDAKENGSSVDDKKVANNDPSKRSKTETTAGADGHSRRGGRASAVGKGKSRGRGASRSKR